jgi:hypothetical protein
VPTFVIGSPIAERSSEFSFEFTGLTVFRNEEDGPALPDNLIAAITEHPLGSDVPCRNTAFGIKQYESVVDNAFNEDPPPFGHGMELLMLHAVVVPYGAVLRLIERSGPDH